MHYLASRWSILEIISSQDPRLIRSRSVNELDNVRTIDLCDSSVAAYIKSTKHYWMQQTTLSQSSMISCLASSRNPHTHPYAECTKTIKIAHTSKFTKKWKSFISEYWLFSRLLTQFQFLSTMAAFAVQHLDLHRWLYIEVQFAMLNIWRISFLKNKNKIKIICLEHTQGLQSKPQWVKNNAETLDKKFALTCPIC